jgi:hypothetical protein
MDSGIATGRTAYPTKTDDFEKEKYILLLDFC